MCSRAPHFTYVVSFQEPFHKNPKNPFKNHFGMKRGFYFEPMDIKELFLGQ